MRAEPFAVFDSNFRPNWEPREKEDADLRSCKTPDEVDTSARVSQCRPLVRYASNGGDAKFRNTRWTAMDSSARRGLIHS